MNRCQSSHYPTSINDFALSMPLENFGMFFTLKIKSIISIREKQFCDWNTWSSYKPQGKLTGDYPQRARAWIIKHRYHNQDVVGPYPTLIRFFSFNPKLFTNSLVIYNLIFEIFEKLHPLKVVPWLPLPRFCHKLIPRYEAITGWIACDKRPQPSKDIDKLGRLPT